MEATGSARRREGVALFRAAEPEGGQGGRTGREDRTPETRRGEGFPWRLLLGFRGRREGAALRS